MMFSEGTVKRVDDKALGYLGLSAHCSVGIFGLVATAVVFDIILSGSPG